MIKAVVFDLDDTLISEREYIKSGFRVVAIEIANDFKINSNKIFDCLCVEFETNTNFVFNRVLDMFAVSYDMEYITKLVKKYREHEPNINLYNDAQKVLEAFYKKGIKLGVITDGYQITQRKKLKVLNIDHYFQHIIITDELGREYWKPHQRPYEIMKQKLHVEYDEMVYVGDNVEKDFVTANKLGISTVLIKRVEGVYTNIQVEEEYMANAQIDSLEILEKVIASNI